MSIRRRKKRELDIALTHFRNYLRVHGYRLSFPARLSLREYIYTSKRRKIIELTLSKREKTLEDVTVGFNRLADESIRFAESQNRTTVTTEDVMRAIKVVFCSVWPFCDGE